MILTMMFTEKYFSDKVHAVLIEKVQVQTMLCDGASFCRKYISTNIIMSTKLKCMVAYACHSKINNCLSIFIVYFSSLYIFFVLIDLIADFFFILGRIYFYVDCIVS